jgi:hypothetical protein
VSKVDGLNQRNTLRCKERRDEPPGGGGFHRRRTRWPEKLTGEFTGKLEMQNFGFRSTRLQAVAVKTDRTSGKVASRSPASI